MHASLVGGDSRFAIERVRTHLPDEGVLSPLSGYSLAATKPIRGSTEATSHPIWPEHHSNWGCALVATGCTMHTRTTGVQGVTKEVSHVRTFQGPCVGALSLDQGGYPYHHPSTPAQTAGAAAGPDRVWRNRSGRRRADRCTVAGF